MDEQIIYQAMYCPCIHESAYATLSIHWSRAGAERAVTEHKQRTLEEWKELDKEFPMMYPYDYMMGWLVSETKILP